MKLVFSFLVMLFSLESNASMVIINYFPGQLKAAGTIKNIFKSRYKIPPNIITINLSTKCISVDKRYLELCINDKGELTELSNTNIQKIKKSLNTFNSGVKNDF